MLAEIFMLKAEATARASKESRSTDQFVPITLPADPARGGGRQCPDIVEHDVGPRCGGGPLGMPALLLSGTLAGEFSVLAGAGRRSLKNKALVSFLLARFVVEFAGVGWLPPVAGVLVCAM